MTPMLHALEAAGRWILLGALSLTFAFCFIAAAFALWFGWQLLRDSWQRRKNRRDSIASGRVTPAVAAYLPPNAWEPPTRERPALADDADESWAAIAAALSGPAPHEPSARERIRREAA